MRTKEGTCSFCSKVRPTVKRLAHDAQICDECVYLGGIRAGLHAAGTLCCAKCKNSKAFVCYSTSGATMNFVFTTQASDGTVLYAPITSSGRLKGPQEPLRSIICVGCQHKLPNWLLKYNPTLAIYYKGNDEQPKPSAPTP